MLIKKVDTLSKAIEVEARKVKKEPSAGQKAIIPATIGDNKKIWGRSFLKR